MCEYESQPLKQTDTIPLVLYCYHFHYHYHYHLKSMLSQAAFLFSLLPLNTPSSLIVMLANLDSNTTPILKARGFNLLTCLREKKKDQSIDQSQSINQNQQTNPSVYPSINQSWIYPVIK